MSTEALNFKSTLNLPQTDFPMKGNLPIKEPEMIANWTSSQTYQMMVEKNRTQSQFVMLDGPPYANGNIHVGHVLNKVLKDIIVKYKNMKGLQATFIPGWDCHGLPIELKVAKKLSQKGLSKEQLRELCRQEAQKWVQRQMEQFVRLGILADWDKPYLTLQPDYEAEEIRVIAQIQENGLLYHGEKPVYWCPKLQTALAAAEVEYLDHKSLSVFVKFPVESSHLDKLGTPIGSSAFVIWTTTPWTLPANYGIALNANFDYGLYRLSHKEEADNKDQSKAPENLLLACELKESVEAACGLTLTQIRSFKGSDLEGLVAHHPFVERESKVVLSDHVTLEAGTGCVHIAPGHGMDDYYVGLKYQLPVHCPVDKAGRYTSEVPKYEGESIWEANPKIVEDLRRSGHLLKVSQLTHSYPHNPRTKTPLIFRATPQWFIRMDDPQYHLRNKALELSESYIQFTPSWGQHRLHSMLSHCPDWCITRQRTWGVPLPVFYCKSCETPLAQPEVMRRIANKMESTGKGIEAFYSTEPSEFTQGYNCPQCQGLEFSRSEDILDVWFDSGVCHSAVQKKREGLSFPADIYIEGSDQHRGWFQTSLMSSLAAHKEPPFKALITHGFVNDSQGNKMSKSKGNVIDPEKIIKTGGAEILRLWTTYEDYGQDVNASNEIFQRVTETYRRIRNTMRFLLGNTTDFNPSENSVPFADMPPIDQWALLKLNDLIDRVTEAYDSYNHYKVYHALNHFYTVDLSALYLDILKDRLYTWKKDGTHRRASQTVLYHLLTHLNKMLAPILSFLSEEIHDYIQRIKGGEKSVSQGGCSSVFLENFPKVHDDWKNDNLRVQMTQVLELRASVYKAIEPMRKNKDIGSSLDAKVAIHGPPETLKTLSSFQLRGNPDYLREILIVSEVTLYPADKLRLEVLPVSGKKCPRCWHYTTKPSTIEAHLGVCPKCIKALT